MMDANILKRLASNIASASEFEAVATTLDSREAQF